MPILNQNRKEFEFRIASQKLYGQYYLPENPKGSILLIHGMGEYSRRYEKNLIPFFLKNSFAVFSYDQFGHGRSEGKRGIHPGFDYLLDSVEAVKSIIDKTLQSSLTFLYGHSMGGNVAINFVLRRSQNFTGMIITSPFLRLAFTPPVWKIMAGKILGRLAPKITMSSELDTEALSRIESEVTAYINDIQIHDRISPSYSLELMKTGQWAIEHASSLKIPMLLAHGKQDRITSFEASRDFASRAGSLVNLKLFENAFHEIHNDLDSTVLEDYIKEWMKSTLNN